MDCCSCLIVLKNAFFSFCRRFFSPGSQRWQKSHSRPLEHPFSVWTNAQGLQRRVRWRSEPALGSCPAPAHATCPEACASVSGSRSSRRSTLGGATPRMDVTGQERARRCLEKRSCAESAISTSTKVCLTMSRGNPWPAASPSSTPAWERGGTVGGGGSGGGEGAPPGSCPVNSLIFLKLCANRQLKSPHLPRFMRTGHILVNRRSG
mmetsp:Transcript_31150/g.84485  ORF Transcript_31150/g.84485 Transcript_31150/m.84485 type:complete len:207 (+) Transcript_31150:190-810(+)